MTLAEESGIMVGELHVTESQNGRTDLYQEFKKNAGPIPWLELAPHFARGAVVHVSKELNIIEVAVQFSEDNKAGVERWMSLGQIGNVSDARAKEWFDRNVFVLAVVVNPWILVQEVSARS
jgi:hypothetical protein